MSAFATWVPTLTHPDYTAPDSGDSGSSGGGTLEGDGPPTDTPTVSAGETVTYWDRQNDVYYVWDTVEAAWKELVA